MAARCLLSSLRLQIKLKHRIFFSYGQTCINAPYLCTVTAYATDIEAFEFITLLNSPDLISKTSRIPKLQKSPQGKHFNGWAALFAYCFCRQTGWVPLLWRALYVISISSLHKKKVWIKSEVCIYRLCHIKSFQRNKLHFYCSTTFI